jgi:hypothetical protein
MDSKKLLHDLSQTASQLKMLTTILENSDMEKSKLLAHLKKIQTEHEANLALIKELIQKSAAN